MVVKKAGLSIVAPDRKGATPSKPENAKDYESQNAYYTRKYKEIHATRRKRRANLMIDPSNLS